MLVLNTPIVLEREEKNTLYITCQNKSTELQQVTFSFKPKKTDIKCKFRIKKMLQNPLFASPQKNQTTVSTVGEKIQYHPALLTPFTPVIIFGLSLSGSGPPHAAGYFVMWSLLHVSV